MLSKLFARGVASRSLVNHFIIAPKMLVQAPKRTFRSDFVNPYIQSPIDLSE